VVQAVAIARSNDGTEYEKHMQSLIGGIGSSFRAQGLNRVLLPCEFWWPRLCEGRRSDIRVAVKVLAQLQDLASEVGITLASPLP
jgi:LDH2 family malate/lactate/ureidoglycolate dehydrogenase